MNTGELPGQERRETAGSSQRSHSSDEAANHRRAKGAREVDRSNDRPRESNSPTVPATDKQGEEDLWQRHKAERGVWSEKMLMALERGIKGAERSESDSRRLPRRGGAGATSNKWFSLIDKVYALGTLELAWAKVQSNAGSCGVDGITTGFFAKDSQSRLLAVNEQLIEGTYQPKPVKRVMIPKPGSAEKRPLGIPTVTDRIVQTALRMVVEPIFEARFAERSYGFRPGRGCKDALRRVDELLKGGRAHVVEVDIKGYFDSIPHERLMALVGEHIADGQVLRLIEKFLTQKIMSPLGWIEAEEQETGTPQGGVISPLLANIYLHPLDDLMSSKGYEMVRYADDMVILCQTAGEAQEALQLLREWMTQAVLGLHPEKTRIEDMGQPKRWFDFLGYRFWRGTNGRLKRYIRNKSKKKLKESLRRETRRCCGLRLEDLAVQLGPRLEGFYGYFKHVSVGALNDVDGWIRGRLRGILRKRDKKRGRGRGRDHQRWSNRYFDQIGLLNLESRRKQELISLRQ